MPPPQRAVGAAPDHPSLLCNYGGLLHTERLDAAGAEAMFRRALRLDPAHVPALCSYAALMMHPRCGPSANEFVRLL